MVRKSFVALSAGFTMLAMAPAQAIVGGQPTSAFEAVGVGVQIAPDWVLTVYHAGLNAGDAYGNGYGMRTVAQRYDPPGSGTFPAHDFALLRLEPAATGAPFLPVLGEAFADGTFEALAATIVSAGNHPPARGYAFTTVSEAQTMIDPDDGGPEPPVTANWVLSWDSSVYAEWGDSAGGLFLGHVGDSSLLIGLTSAQLTDKNNVPIGSGFVQPAAYRSWIDAVMAADPNDDQQVLWQSLSAIPEPATWALWLGGLAAAAWRRRRA